MAFFTALVALAPAVAFLFSGFYGHKDLFRDPLLLSLAQLSVHALTLQPIRLLTNLVDEGIKIDMSSTMGD